MHRPAAPASCTGPMHWPDASARSGNASARSMCSTSESVLRRPDLFKATAFKVAFTAAIVAKYRL
jgi:hypothetical protein